MVVPHAIVPLVILPSVGPLELGIIFTVVLILFGPGKLPDVFRALGDGVRQFKEASRSISSEPYDRPVAALPENPPVTPQVTTSAKD